MLSPVTSDLGWGRAAGSQGWTGRLLILETPHTSSSLLTLAPACPHQLQPAATLLSASTVHRPGQTSLPLKSSIAPQSPGLSPEFTAYWPHWPLGFWSGSFLCLSFCVQSLHKASSTLPVAPSLCTPIDPPASCPAVRSMGGHQPKVHDLRPCWQAQREGVVHPGSSPQAAKIKYLETQAQVNEILTAGPDMDDVTQFCSQ